jgi:hypothetical protein
MTKVLVGTTIVRNSAYILDKFLENQKKIQDNFTGSELVIATDELKFLGYLKRRFEKHELKGKVIYYETQKPDFAKDRNWSMSAGRQECRQYMFTNNFDFLLIVDSDMIYDNSLIQILLGISNRYDVVQSGYKSKHNSSIGFGGCNLIRKEILRKVNFHCREFKNGTIIEEGNMFEYDTFRKKAKIKKGVFVWIDHYSSSTEKFFTNPRKLSKQKRFMIRPLIRYLIVALSLYLKKDISTKLQNIFIRNRKNV